MIWLRNPLIVAGVGIAATIVAFYTGRMIGHAQGVAHQKSVQVEIDRKRANEIRERVVDALDEMGATASDDDVDRLLRELSGE